MRRLSRSLGLALVLGAAAVAATANPIGPLTLVQSPFIGDLSGLQPQPSPSSRHLYLKPGIDLSRYDSVIVDPVSTVILPKASIVRAREADLADICQEFTKEIAYEVGRSRTIATSPGPSTLQIHVTLTDLIPNRADLAFNDITGLEKSFGVGAAAVQVEFRDSATGELLAALTDAKHGEDFRYNFNKLTVWGDVDDITFRWSRAIAKQLTADAS